MKSLAKRLELSSEDSVAFLRLEDSEVSERWDTILGEEDSESQFELKVEPEEKMDLVTVLGELNSWELSEGRREDSEELEDQKVDSKRRGDSEAWVDQLPKEEDSARLEDSEPKRREKRLDSECLEDSEAWELEPKSLENRAEDSERADSE